MNATLRRVRLAHVAALALMGALSAWAWLRLPADALVPTHWNAAGEVDGSSGKALGLMLAPGISLAVLALFSVLPAIEPRRRHLLESAGAYAVVWVAVAGMLAAVHAIMVAAALGQAPAVQRLMPALIGTIFLAMAWVMPRIRSNFMMGIRTPWTLSSEASWRKTHAAGRWVFGAVGLALWGAALVGAGGEAFLGLVIGGALAASFGLMAYSYLVWRDDPERAADGAAR